MRFIPLASEISMGAIAPRNREGIKDETKDIRQVELYASGYKRNILEVDEPLVDTETKSTTHSGNLITRETFMGSTTSTVCKSLSATKNFFQSITILRG
jgi:hypothetical protein